MPVIQTLRTPREIGVLLALAFGASILATGLVRRYALSRNVLDVPNERSSHRVPTPRAGGMSIVVTFLAGVIVLAVSGVVERRIGLAIVGAGAVVALVGFIDDHRPLAAAWRLLVHVIAAAWVLAWLGGLPPLRLGGVIADFGLVGDALAAIALVWLLNLYNFMDGIDGIAGVEAVTVCAGALALAAARGYVLADWVLPGLLGAAVMGFLVWNFPPAKIFMGDAGSGFLGLMLGILAVHAGWVSPDWLWSWIILLGVFVVDATVTLLRRLQQRQKVYQAHRTHAYQHAALKAGRHGPVTLAVAAVNLLWLLPLALLVGTGRLDGLLGTAIAYAPLAFLALRLDAGRAAS